jgi:hypothetical protein
MTVASRSRRKYVEGEEKEEEEEEDDVEEGKV